jgi:hypothetical protein
MRLHNIATKIALLCALAGAQTIGAQTWTISTVVDNTTACPGSSGGFFNPSQDFPAINGPWVVFLDAGDDNCTANSGQSIWSYNLITKALYKLVDTNTAIPAPAGAGNFEGFNQGPFDNLQVQDGTVLFYGYGAGYNPTTNCSGGLYTVSVKGGAIYRTVDYTMTLPGYGGSLCQIGTSYGINGLLGMSLYHGLVVFSAQANPGANDGVWLAPANVNTTESDLYLIADASTVYQGIYEWSGGFIGSTGVAFTGGGQVGLNGLFLNTPSAPILTSSYVLPGDTAHNSGYPEDASFYIGPVVDGDNIFFLASDPFYQGNCAGGAFVGVFRTGLTGGTATNVLNTCDTQPNGDALGLNSFNQLAANEGTAVFPVQDNITGNYVLDASVNGALSAILAPGEALPSGASCTGAYHATGCATSVSPAGTGGISGGRVAFSAVGGPYWYDVGIYVASLPCAANVTSDVSITLGSLTYNSSTKLWSETVTVKNTGARAITGPLSLVLTDLPSGISLTNRSASTVCFAPEGSPYVNLYLTPNNTLPAGTSTPITLEFSDPSDASITFSSEVAGTGAR